MPTIQTQIIIPSRITENAAMVIFVISNTGSDDVFVLRRNTPLEGLKSDCLEVTLDGQHISYDGYLFKRAEVTDKEYMLLKAGETKSVQVDLSEAYDVSRPGIYEVKFDDSLLIIKPVSGTKDLKLTGENNIEFEINNIESFLEIVTDVHLPVGARMRTEAKKKLIKVSNELTVGAKEPEVKGSTSEQQKQIVRKAHSDGYAFAAKAFSSIEDNDIYQTWFGTYTNGRSATVKNNFKKLIERMGKISFTYDLKGSECSDDTFAYTTTGGSVIWLCKKFWDASAVGYDSKAGTIVHEHTHASSNTDDHYYGQDNCKQLAKSDPDTALKNADNYEYYSEELNLTAILIV